MMFNMQNLCLLTWTMQSQILGFLELLKIARLSLFLLFFAIEMSTDASSACTVLAVKFLHYAGTVETR